LVSHVAGFVGESHFTHSGGGVNYQCMPTDPQYNRAYTGSFAGSLIYGTEYESGSYGIFPDSAHDQNVPCARCYTENRPALMMIPASTMCQMLYREQTSSYDDSS